MQRTQMPAFDEISHSTAERAAIASMAAIAAMAAMATVMSSTGIGVYGNQMRRRQETFGMCTESSLAGVWFSIV
jgi:adenylosuccinate lyase